MGTTKDQGKKTKEKRSSMLLACFCQAQDADRPKECAENSVPKGVAASDELFASPKLKQRSPMGSVWRIREVSHRLPRIKTGIFSNTKVSGRSRKIQQDPTPSPESSESVNCDPFPAVVTPRTQACESIGSPSSQIDWDSSTSADSMPSPNMNIIQKTPSPSEEDEDEFANSFDLIVGLCYLVALSLAGTVICAQAPALSLTPMLMYLAGLAVRWNLPENEERIKTPVASTEIDPTDLGDYELSRRGSSKHGRHDLGFRTPRSGVESNYSPQMWVDL